MKLVVYGDTVAALTTAAVLADTGNQVALVCPGDTQDILNHRLAVEPGLEPLFEAARQAGRLKLTTLEQVVDRPVHFFVMRPEQQAWAEQLAGRLAQGVGPCTLINRATFPIGTSEALQARIQTGRSCALVVEPDFVPEGRAVHAFTRPDRILIGTDSAAAEALIRELYRPFNRNRDVIQVLSPRAAEMTKFATNAMLATRISFINEMAQLAEALDVDIEQVRQGLGSDHRIGFDFLYPGLGFGGPNFARDVARLADTLRERGVDGTMLEAVLAVNEAQKEVLFRKAWQHFGYELQGRVFALWGLSYKPLSASVENAPSVPLAQTLIAQGARVRVHDPAATAAFVAALPERLRHQVVVCDTPEAAVEEADGVMLLTEWKCYWHPDWEALKGGMRTPVVFDGRNIYPPERVRQVGFEYYGVGRR